MAIWVAETVLNSQMGKLALAGATGKGGSSMTRTPSSSREERASTRVKSHGIECESGQVRLRVRENGSKLRAIGFNFFLIPPSQRKRYL